jgi:hypothetical protein
MLLLAGVCSCGSPSPGSRLAADAMGGGSAEDPVVRAQTSPRIGGEQPEPPMGGGYRTVTRSDGSSYYISKLKNLASNASQQPSTKPSLAPPDEGLTVCPIRVVGAPPQVPSRWDLHAAFGDEDLLSPVHDQMARGSCTIFAETSALETEYVVAYSRSHSEAETQAFREQFNLSEQYLMDMAFLTVSVPLFVDSFWNNTPGPYDSPPLGTVTTANLTALNPTCGGTPLLGLPRVEDWPTARADATILYPMMQSVPMLVDGRAAVGPVDTYAFSSILSLPQASPPAVFSGLLSTVGVNGRPLELNLDLANFGWSDIPGTLDPAHSVYPPSSVHEGARYAPSKWVSLQAYNANAQTPQTLPSPCRNAHIWDYPIVTPSSAPSADQVACYEALAAPFEMTLSENHPIIIGTDVDAWNFDSFPLTAFTPPMSSPSYWTGGGDFSATTLLDCGDSSSGNPNGCSGPYPLVGSGDHTVLLIGYDHGRQLFHIKNSWGTAWGTGQGASGSGAPDGTAWMTYDLFFRTVIDPAFVDGVWDPTGAMATDDPVPEPIPNGAWFGFWQAKLGGSPGVAVIGHFPQNTSLLDPNAGIAYGRPGEPYGTFYPLDGTTPTTFRLNTWGSAGKTYWADFEAMGPLPHQFFRLTQTFGAALPRVTWTDLSSPSSAPTTWSKCSENTSLLESQLDTLPTWYTDVLFDPYIFPPCDGSAWHVDPTWTCPDGGDYVSEVQYQEGALPGSGQENEVTRLCLLAGGPPECPYEGPVGLPPPPQSIYEDIDPVNMNSAIEPDQFGDLEEGWAAMPSWVDVCAPTSAPSCLTGGDCALPSCPTHAEEAPFTKVPLLGANPWVWVRQGTDVCVASAYAPTAVCPAGYTLSPNGTDCLIGSGR